MACLRKSINFFLSRIQSRYNWGCLRTLVSNLALIIWSGWVLLHLVENSLNVIGTKGSSLSGSKKSSFSSSVWAASSNISRSPIRVFKFSSSWFSIDRLCMILDRENIEPLLENELSKSWMLCSCDLSFSFWL